MEKLSLKLFNPNSRNERSKQRCVINRLRYASGYTQQDAGFTLLELIAVILMIGILAAIASPSWIGFINQQQVNKANNAVLAALQEAQREAKRNKLSYSVSFEKNTTTQALGVAIYPTKKVNGSDWTVDEIREKLEPLGKNMGANFNQLLLGANLNGENTISTTDSTVRYPPSSTPTKITFDYMGALPTLPDPYLGADTGLKIAVAVPSSTNSTLASSIKRCVIVKTLLGSMLTSKDSSNCD